MSVKPVNFNITKAISLSSTDKFPEISLSTKTIIEKLNFTPPEEICNLKERLVDLNKVYNSLNNTSETRMIFIGIAVASIAVNYIILTCVFTPLMLTGLVILTIAITYHLYKLKREELALTIVKCLPFLVVFINNKKFTNWAGTQVQTQLNEAATFFKQNDILTKLRAQKSQFNREDFLQAQREILNFKLQIV